MTYRDAIDALRRAGAVPVRTRGSHQTWALPTGERQTVVCNHLGARADAGLLAQLRKLAVLPAKGVSHA